MQPSFIGLNRLLLRRIAAMRAKARADRKAARALTKAHRRDIFAEKARSDLRAALENII